MVADTSRWLANTTQKLGQTQQLLIALSARNVMWFVYWHIASVDRMKYPSEEEKKKKKKVQWFKVRSKTD